MPVLLRFLQIIQKQILFLPGEPTALLRLEYMRLLQFPEHVIARVAADIMIIDRQIEDLMEHRMYSVYRSRTQVFVIHQGIVKPFHVRFPYFFDQHPPESRFDIQVVRVFVILKRIVLEAPFQITPHFENVVDRGRIAFDPDPFVLVIRDLFFLFTQLLQRFCIDRMPFPVSCCPAIVIRAILPLRLSLFEDHAAFVLPLRIISHILSCLSFEI